MFIAVFVIPFAAHRIPEIKFEKALKQFPFSLELFAVNYQISAQIIPHILTF
jgi:hypothetical protein